MRYPLLIAALAASTLFAGCSGGGGGGSSPNPTMPGNPGTSSTQKTISAISDEEALGSPLKDFADFDKTADTSSLGAPQSSTRTRSVTPGTCSNGVEFFAPDKNGDADSTETIDFYDPVCAVEARDVVRIYTSTGATSETVNLTEALFAPGNTTPIATRTETHAISNATFNRNGYPLAADGYDLVASDDLNIAGSRTLVGNRELVMAPATSGTNAFCTDAAGYNATGFLRLGITFGWNGGVLSGGSRTVNSDGSVTWTATQTGTLFKGAIGSLSVASGTQNTACPIATPMFTLAGGTALGSYSIPITVTYVHGMLESLTITNATLSNGDSLSVTTNPGQAPSSVLFITGTIANGSTQLATFAVDAFGDGTLTVTATGAEYIITDWHVVR